MTCRICYEDDIVENLIQPCSCNGSTAFVHNRCLTKWLDISGRTNCEICHFEYEVVEVEEDKRICCPPCVFSDSVDMSVAVTLIGLVGNVFILFFTTFWGNDTENIFFYGNTLQCFMLLILYPNIRPREVLVFWKSCSTTCLMLASLLQNEFKYLFIEATCTLMLAVHAYAHLVVEHKQTVRYINIVDRSLNDETV